MSTMVEKVARSIYEKALAQRPLTPFGMETDWPAWAELSDKDRNYALGEARAAINAMMEPTYAMRKVCDFETAEITYPAMIQAALKEGQ